MQKPGETRSFVLDLKGVNGKKFLLQVADYAMNVVTYEVNIQIGEPLPAPDMIAFDSSANSWIGFGRNDDLTTAQTLSTSKGDLPGCNRCGRHDLCFHCRRRPVCPE